MTDWKNDELEFGRLGRDIDQIVYKEEQKGCKLLNYMDTGCDTYIKE